MIHVNLFILALGVIFLAIVLIWTFIWKKFGLGKGRQYGNKLAAYLGWRPNFFHTVLENGVEPSLMILSALDSEGVAEDQALVRIAPYLAQGLLALEGRFGPQDMIEDAKPAVIKLMSEWEATQQE